MLRFCFILYSLVFILSSCSKEIEIDIDEPDPTLVAFSVLSENQKIQIRFSELIPILDDYDYSEYLEGILVILYENSVAIDTLLPDSSGVYRSQISAEFGKQYFFTAYLDGYPEISSSTILPTKPDVVDSYLVDSALVTTEGEHKAMFKIIIDDPVYEVNYYEISLLKVVDDTTRYYLSPYTITDPVIDAEGLSQYELYSILVSDEFINGTQHEFSVYYDYEYGINGAQMIIGEVRTLSHGLFEFKKSLVKHMANQQGYDFIGILQPVTQYTNIENGLGVFGAESVFRDTLRIY